MSKTFSYSVKTPTSCITDQELLFFWIFRYFFISFQSNFCAEVALPQLTKTVSARLICATKDLTPMLNPQHKNAALFSNKHHEIYCKVYHYATSGSFLQYHSLFLLTTVGKILNMFRQKNLLIENPGFPMLFLSPNTPLKSFYK